jgi:hypothetical protein
MCSREGTWLGKASEAEAELMDEEGGKGEFRRMMVSQDQGQVSKGGRRGRRSFGADCTPLVETSKYHPPPSHVWELELDV